ncbi:MAG: ABC transporter permease, partial [Gammaproteobacteria bacterium]|nr:ABC transporter permease [Gammaproteobacteria bacterium]
MYQIALTDLALGFIPVVITVVIMLKWSLSINKALLSILRMLLQLMLIGYALNFIFNSGSSLIILLVLCLMLLAASWISMSTIHMARSSLVTASLVAISIGGIFTLIVTTQGVLHLDPWYQPQIMIPIAGMIFSNAMNTISLAAERFYSEWKHQADYQHCRNIAFQAAMIPVFNALLAVGLVSLPGMMTGQ